MYVYAIYSPIVVNAVFARMTGVLLNPPSDEATAGGGAGTGLFRITTWQDILRMIGERLGASSGEHRTCHGLIVMSVRHWICCVRAWRTNSLAYRA